MSQPFRHYATTIPLADGRVMVAGGNGPGWALDGAEIFDIDYNMWSQINSMSMSRSFAAATELLDGRILIVGGFTQTSTGANQITKTAETYLPCPANLAPIALCQNRIVYTHPDSLDPNALACVVPGGAEIDVNDGSYDPDNFPGALTVWQTPSGPYRLGNNTVSLIVSDGSLTSTCTATVTVVDGTPPVPGGSKGMVLWPPDSTLHEVSLMDCAGHLVDACSGRLIPLKNYATITKITSDEEENIPGNSDGNTVGDMEIKKPWLALLRAERTTVRDGRVYTVHYQAKDPSGNVANSSCKVTVPIVAGSTAVEGPPLYCVGTDCSP